MWLKQTVCAETFSSLLTTTTVYNCKLDKSNVARIYYMSDTYQLEIIYAGYKVTTWCLQVLKLHKFRTPFFQVNP